MLKIQKNNTLIIHFFNYKAQFGKKTERCLLET